MLHPAEILFAEEKTLPRIPAVEHYAGTRERLEKALQKQQQMGPLFDITGDCEDGAPAGNEREHAVMVASLIASEDNCFSRIGARIHDLTHPCWQEDLDLLLAGAGRQLAYLTFPKIRSAADARQCLAALRQSECRHSLPRQIPAHFLIETHGALAEVREIAALPGVETLDFGIMDFISSHHGAIPAEAMHSPLQFSHPLIVRAKCEISAAALAAGVVPAHNVCTTLNAPVAVANDARRARQEFAYLRMWSIHPEQITPILEAMQPDRNEVDSAISILIAAQEAKWGPIAHGGRLHDRASYRYFWDLLCRAHSTGMEIPTAVIGRFLA